MMKRRLLLLDTFFIVCITTQLHGAISSRADRAFIENAEQYQAEEGVNVEALYHYKQDLESQSTDYNQESGPLVNKYLPPVVEKTSNRAAPKKAKSFGFSFTQMAEKTQKKATPNSFGFSFSSLAKNIQKTPTENSK
jgi:hypothetical protein